MRNGIHQHPIKDGSEDGTGLSERRSVNLKFIYSKVKAKAKATESNLVFTLKSDKDQRTISLLRLLLFNIKEPLMGTVRA